LVVSKKVYNFAGWKGIKRRNIVAFIALMAVIKNMNVAIACEY